MNIYEFAAAYGLFVCGLPGFADQAQGGKSGVAIAEVSAPEAAVKRYTVRADDADIRYLFSEIFKKSDDPFTLDLDVGGPVDLLLKDVTIPEILEAITKLARPPLKIAR